MSMLGTVHMETVAGTAGVVGAVGLADGGHKGWSARHNDEVEAVRVETWNETDGNERQEKKEREKGEKTVTKGGRGTGQCVKESKEKESKQRRSRNLQTCMVSLLWIKALASGCC
ncbi:hypothetical protein PAMP_019099 [Pampus punctatissimus]